MREPLAYFMTWTTYGTWLHGDARGSVDRDHNVFGQPLVPADRMRVRLNRASLRCPPVLLSDTMRAVVRDVIVEHCPFRGVNLLALSVRTNHVHLIVSADKDDPGNIAGRFKARATLMLRESGLAGPASPVWTSRGSERHLWTLKAVAKAVAYVLRQGPENDP